MNIKSQIRGLFLFQFAFMNWFGFTIAQTSIIPKPFSLIADSGLFLLNPKTKIVILSDEYKTNAEIFNRQFQKDFGFRLEIVKLIPKEKYILLKQADSD